MARHTLHRRDVDEIPARLTRRNCAPRRSSSIREGVVDDRRRSRGVRVDDAILGGEPDDVLEGHEAVAGSVPHEQPRRRDRDVADRGADFRACRVDVAAFHADASRARARSSAAASRSLRIGLTT